jgi:hypothetical protein
MESPPQAAELFAEDMVRPSRVSLRWLALIRLPATPQSYDGSAHVS